MSNLAIPFLLKESSASLIENYPDSQLIKNVFSKASEHERSGIIRLWLTEGIPYAFKENPILYEEIRSFVADGIRIHPKEITLVGSGRIGYSLKPEVWGRKFSKKSDLDFTIVSNSLYTKLVEDFQNWVKDIESKKIIPKNQAQLKSWLGSIETADRNIDHGYIYIKNLFPHKFYNNVSRCYYTIGKLKERLVVTPNSPQVDDISIRIYSAWEKCIRQIQVNLKSSLNIK